MRPNRFKRIATALAIAGMSAVLVGCGSRGNNNPVPPVINSPSIPGIPGMPGGGSCVPINQAIPFQGQGIYFSYTSIVGGYVPNSQQSVGQIVVGGGGGGGPFQRNAVDLNISMNVLPAQMQYQGTYPPGYPNSIYPGSVPGGYQNPTYPGPIGGYNQWQGFGQSPGLANVTGVIQINPATQQQIMMQFGGGMTGYPGQQYPGYPQQGYGQVPCVSGIAFNLGNYNGLLYGGFVWLYLNGTQHGVYYPI